MVNFLRHAVTAAHCICTYEANDLDSTETHCLESTQNQIQPSKNIIFVAGGSESAELLDDKNRWDLRWDIHVAYIIHDDVDKHDIGIIELTKPETFFNPVELLTEGKLNEAEIVPICLGSSKLEQSDMPKFDIQGVGWGIQYEEIPRARGTGSIRDPIISSCMTNQASPESWKFQSCDMQRMKQPGVGHNSWACEKIRPPPEYKDGQDQRCRNYFTTFGTVLDQIEPTQNLAESKLNDIDVMYVNDGKGIKETCYNPQKLSRYGWCYLKDYPEKYERNWDGIQAWGTCSPSCKTQLMQVYDAVIGFKAIQ